MARRWETNARDRKSRKYIALHEQLKSELSQDIQPDLSKRERKMARIREYLAGQT